MKIIEKPSEALEENGITYDGDLIIRGGIDMVIFDHIKISGNLKLGEGSTIFIRQDLDVLGKIEVEKRGSIDIGGSLNCGWDINSTDLIRVGKNVMIIGSLVGSLVFVGGNVDVGGNMQATDTLVVIGNLKVGCICEVGGDMDIRGTISAKRLQVKSLTAVK